MKTHKAQLASEPAVNEYERIATEQFAQASQDYRNYAAHASKLGKILMEAGIPPDTRTALGLFVNGIGLLRSNNVNPALIIEALGGILAAAHGPMKPGGLQENLAEIADVRAARIGHLMEKAHKNHKLTMDLDTEEGTIEGAPLSLIVAHVRGFNGAYRLDVTVNFHDAAKDPDSAAPEITMRTALLAAEEAVKRALAETTDPKGAN